jgi:hypothetical protein
MMTLSKRLLILGGSLLIVALSTSAFAVKDAETRAMIRQSMNGDSIALIAGPLTCTLSGGENQGQACTLKIRDLKTGKIFQLTNAGEARGLYAAGTTNVAIQGTVSTNDAGEGTLEVTRISAQ